MDEPISAVATAQGRGGVAIVRVSGEGVLALARAMFEKKGDFVPNHLYPGVIDCGEFSDYGMCVYFRAPHSFTGEDVVEFHCHGGAQIARGVLRRTQELGARLALPGEFTKRAFLNGKLSLSAVEGLGEMIGAQSAAQARAGFALYSEKLTEEGKRLRKLILECLAGVDADIDYPEEGLESDLRESVLEKTAAIQAALKSLSERYRSGKKIKSGVSVALCGRPNAGKSTLFNALLGYDRAIVSSVPGTTRDTVEGMLEIGGVLFRLIDTAGLRESSDEVEKEGIRRARNALKAADLIVYLKEEEPFELPDGGAVLTVGAKCDLKREPGCDLYVSARTGEGVEELKAALYEKGFGAEDDGVYLMEERQFDAVKAAYEAVRRAREGAMNGEEPALFAENLKAALDALGRVDGETAREDVIEEIFSKFCVGK